jgi:hypothetical protein
MNLDELNCPACDEEPLMRVFEGVVETAEGYANATFVACPHCGFQVASRYPLAAEHAIRVLQGRLWDAMSSAEEAGV